MKNFAAALLVVSLTGCTSLEAVSDISDRLVSASRSWDEVSDDIAASCERQRSINPANQDCRLEQTATESLADVNAVLDAYFTAMGAAANEGNFTIEPGLERATTSVSNIPGINQDHVAAVSGLFGVLARIATGAMRERTLRQLIDEGAPPAQRIISGLDATVVPLLMTRLSGEATQLDAHFVDLIGGEGADIGSDPHQLCTSNRAAGFRGAAFLLSLEYCERRQALVKREKALAEYGESLRKANEALDELQSSRTRLGSSELAAQLIQTGWELSQKVEAVREAFA